MMLVLVRMLVISFILITSNSISALAACGANTRTWQADAGSTNWNTNANWNPANRPNTAAENAVIVSDWFFPTYPAISYTLGCLEIQSGGMTADNDRTLTLEGDYFRNLNPGSLLIGATNLWEVIMEGTAAQTFENVDTIPRLRINNATTVTLTESFDIRDRFLIDAGSGEVIIQKNLTTTQTGAFTIESGTTVTMQAGSSWTLNGDLTINGILVMGPGSQIMMANGSTITVGAGATLDINGTAGNAVTIAAENSSSSYSFTVTGTLDAQYLVLNYLDGTGVAMNGTVSRFDNVSINGIPSAGAAFTLGAAVTLPASMNAVGFFDDGTAGPFTNVNASAYSGSAVSMTNWSGIGDTGNENDPSGVINWGTEATPVLQVQNVSGAGVPPATIAKGSGATQFATFAFSMSGTAASATNVTQVILTLDGSNINSDVTSIDVYNDNNGNCSYDGGTDLLIGSYTPAGTPGTVTVNMTTEINVIDTTQDCFHVFLSTAVAATTDNTIGISIEATDDVTNDQSYALSDTTGPPVNPGVASITGAAVAKWNGGFTTNMFTTGNWIPNAIPTTTTDCEIGNGYQPPDMSAAFDCQNTRFQNSGTINWNNTANIFNVYGAWTVENGFTYNNSANAIVNIRGAGDQSVTLDTTTFPNDVTINSGGIVTFEDSGTISGDLTISAGSVEIASGASLTVSGNITINTGTTLDIEPGGTLIMGNGSTITVNSGGTIEMVGTSISAASVRAINDVSSMTITVNNGATINAQYYSLRNLGATGLTVNATATINPTNFLQNGNFTFPGVNNANQLRLFQEIPGDVLDGMSFDADGSGATGVISVFTSTGATADTLSMTNYAGDQTGGAFTNDTNYLVSWDSETNELKLTQEATAPASSNQGDVVDMGTFGFQQLNAGSFNDTDITYIRITLTGTGASSDVDSVSLYYDSACSGSGGTLIGNKTFSGNPARAEFTSITGATVQADVATPPLRCFNVEYNINSLATDGKTVGAEITSSTHVTNSEGFEFNSSFAPAVNLGTTSIVGVTTQWTGATDTDWFTAGNWSSGLPTSSLNCIINDQANDPVIGGGTAVCKSMSIGNGTLTHTAGTLEIYGSLESTGTITSSAPVVIRDNGATPTSQNIDVSSTLNEIQFNKTAGGSVNINSSVTVNNAMSISGAQNFTMNITANNSLILTNGLTLSGAIIDMDSASELQIGGGQTLLVNGGTFRTSGVNDAYPQTLANKAHITNTGGSSTWTFSATSGTVDLTGFYIDWLNTSGLNISGTTTLSNLNGGQLRNLPATASMRALQLNTSGSIPATSSNFGWNWGPDNSPPSEATAYFLGFSSGCGSQTIDFDQWFGDFWPFTTAVTTDKISASSCTILIDRAKSPVSLTRLEATPYDSKVVIEWTTGNEWDHKGFNVYRSHNPDDSFVQINEKMIRNDLFATTIHGTYAFIDEGVTNGQTYYYMLEDLSLVGESTLHGPLSASPDASLGNPPTIQAGTIASSSNQNSGGGSDASGGDTLEISDNVWLLSQTENYMRLKIVVPNISFSADPLNPAFEKIAIDGYSSTTKVGAPELLSKSVLVGLPENLGNVQFDIVSETVSNFAGKDITPSPQYQPVADTLVAQWYQDAAAYSVNSVEPTDFIDLSDVVEISGSHYIPLLVHPVKYNPVTKDLVKANEIIVDLHLQGTPPWSSVDPSLTPWKREAGIKVGFSTEGMYRITYQQLADAGVVAPIEGQDISDIHMKISSVKLGIEIKSGDSVFGPGDEIIFYGPSLRSDEDLNTYALIYADSSESSSQASVVDAAVGAEPLYTDKGFWTKKLYEENNTAVFNEPYTEETDHFVWSLIYGVSGGVNSPLDFDIDLPHLSNTGSVVFRVVAKSRTANSYNTNHNLKLYINGQEDHLGDQSFQAVEAKAIQFEVASDKLVAGKNRIKLVATGDNLPVGEYDMLYIDRVDVFYHQDWLVDTDEALILDRQQGYSYQVGGFTGADIDVYDVSSPLSLVKFNNLNISSNADGHFVEFALNGASNGRRLWAGRPSQLKSANSFKLISGSNWGSSNNSADIVYMGHKDLLGIAKQLGALRETQGYQVEYVDLESIYNEFGLGKANVSAVKEFIQTARTWQKAPRFYVILGDGTYDPKAYQNSSLKYRFPVKYKMGSSFDYVSDHWFVANDAGIPQEVIGRIPAKSKQDLQIYVDKVLDYESGVRQPAKTSAIQFISDKPAHSGEDFDKPISDIQGLSTVSKLQNPYEHIKRTELTDTELKQQISSSFSNSSLIHYMGHGAENMWADMGVFTNNDVELLANQKLPIVVAMNCLNAHFADPSLDSFAEALLFNPKGGSVAFWGSTSFTPPSIQKLYQESFYRNLNSGSQENFGELAKFSKIEIGLSSPFEELLYSWSIIGDPLVRPALDYQESRSIDEAPVATPPPQAGVASGGSGCSANASAGHNKATPNLTVLISFLLEVLMVLLVIRLAGYWATRKQLVTAE